jgi:hypothetical protein
MKEDEVGGTSSMHGRDKTYIQYFGWKILIEETTQKT